MRSRSNKVPYKTVGDVEYRNEDDNVLAVAKHTSSVSTEGQDVIETRSGFVKYFNFLAAKVTTLSYESTYNLSGDVEKAPPQVTSRTQAQRFADITDPKARQEVRDMHAVLIELGGRPKRLQI